MKMRLHHIALACLEILGSSGPSTMASKSAGIASHISCSSHWNGRENRGGLKTTTAGLGRVRKSLKDQEIPKAGAAPRVASAAVWAGRGFSTKIHWSVRPFNWQWSYGRRIKGTESGASPGDSQAKRLRIAAPLFQPAQCVPAGKSPDPGAFSTGTGTPGSRPFTKKRL
ncbi:hypothetical protein AAY473_037948 [Plecturocebus cupreus]